MPRPKRRTFKVTVVVRRGITYIRLRPPTGKGQEKLQPPQTDDPESEARAIEARLNARLAPKNFPADPKLVDVFARHVEWRATDHQTQPNTLRSYQGVRVAVVQAFGGTLSSQLDRAVVRGAQQALLRLGRKPSYVNLVLQKVSKAWAWAAEEGIVAGPWPKVAALTAPKTEHRPFHHREVERFYLAARDYAGGRYLALFVLLGEVGSRIGETVRLQGQDVDRQAKTVTFRAETTKTRRPRTCAVSAEVLALVPKRKAGEWIFRAALRPERHMPERSAIEALYRCLKKVGLRSQPLVLHSLRGYVVRKLHSAGVPLKDAMDYVGHRSARVHLSYMEGAERPSQHSMLVAARHVHDPLGALGPRKGPQKRGKT